MTEVKGFRKEAVRLAKAIALIPWLLGQILQWSAIFACAAGLVLLCIYFHELMLLLLLLVTYPLGAYVLQRAMVRDFKWLRQKSEE